MLVIGHDLGAVGQPRLSDEHHEPLGQSHERLPLYALGRDRPLLLELAHKGVGGVLIEVDGAPGAERPAAGPRGQPWCAPACEPAPVGGARDAQRGDAVGGVAGYQSQRPAQGLELELDALAVGAVTDHTSGDPVVAGGAALLQGGDRSVGCSGMGRRGLEALLAPAGEDPLQRPRPAGEDLRLLGGLLGGWRVLLDGGLGFGGHLVRGRLVGCSRCGVTPVLGMVSTLDSALVEARRRKHWGWGYEDEQASPAEVRATAGWLAGHLGLGEVEVEDPVALEAVRLVPPRVLPPVSLAEICASDAHARAAHALGKSYMDVVRGFRGRFEDPPDFVARPRDEREIEGLLEWCAAERVAAIPYGGGTSVVGGVQPAVDSSYNGAVSIDLGALDRVLEVDPVSRAARIQAGATGPRLEQQLGEQGLTLRHFPQSFELATLGGWIATRAAGHFATVWTHIEDFVESVRALTPTGAWESRRLPGSGAGVSPDRMLAGSEGTLGVIVEAWMRVQPRPTERRSVGVRFPSFAQGAECVRALAQSGLNPANCRLIDPREAQLTGAGDGSCALLVLGFESSDHPVDGPLGRALELCREHGGEVGERDGAGGDAVGSWREAFLRVPYLRDVFVAMGVISETFETAITWERYPMFHERVTEAAEQALREVGATGGRVMCRFTHVYPDGPAPYFTVIARGRRGGELEQWAAVKQAVSATIIREGGTITHHHAVGRDHRPWYDRQRPEPFAQALRAAKAAVDPQGIMNPGVLVDPLPVDRRPAEPLR